MLCSGQCDVAAVHGKYDQPPPPYVEAVQGKAHVPQSSGTNHASSTTDAFNQFSSTVRQPQSIVHYIVPAAPSGGTQSTSSSRAAHVPWNPYSTRATQARDGLPGQPRMQRTARASELEPSIRCSLILSILTCFFVSPLCGCLGLCFACKYCSLWLPGPLLRL